MTTQTQTTAAKFKTFLPKTDVIELAESYQLLLEMPGIDKDSIEISLEKQILSVKGTYKKQPIGKALRLEYPQGHFERSFEINGDIVKDAIEANFEDGLLQLTLPKTKETQPHKITVH